MARIAKRIAWLSFYLFLIGFYVVVSVGQDKKPAELTFATGDVFVAVGDGKVQWRHSDGTFVQLLDAGDASGTRGMAFDSRLNLYVTGFGARKLSRFDPHGNRIDTFGSGYDCYPESIVFDLGGKAYVGQANSNRGDLPDCSKKILESDPSGKPLAGFAVTTENRGSDWIDLAADQCTMYYTF